MAKVRTTRFVAACGHPDFISERETQLDCTEIPIMRNLDDGAVKKKEERRRVSAGAWLRQEKAGRKRPAVFAPTSTRYRGG